MKIPLGRIPDPLARVLVVFVLLVGAFLGVRFVLPPSVKDSALNVQATVARESARPIRFSGSAPCAECHDEYNVRKRGHHRTLSCETCHGPAAQHAANPTETKPEAPRKRVFCVLCHQYDPSRPTGFPQINPAAHNPLRPCIECHNPHDPKPPTVPGECEACHAEIARTKAVSPHVLLQCTTCHTATEAHKSEPRLNAATIPAERDFCGKCHAAAAKTSGAPKVDFATHGEKYLCWQCHYPHMPEVK